MIAPMMLQRLGALLAPLLLGACALGPVRIDPNNDALRGECHWDLHYPAVAPADASLAQLRAIATQRLAALDLVAEWTLDSEVATAAAFDDSAADRQRLQRLLSTVLPGLERYPAEVFASVRLRHVALVKELAVAGQRRLAMPAAESERIIYADNGAARLCPAGMEMRVHHEFYHFIDYRQFQDYYHADPAWLALNPADVRYGRGGATSYGKNFIDLGHPQQGMVSLYATYGIEEDKAETFGWMMTPDYAARVDLWVRDDPALARKVHFMREQLRMLARPVLAKGD